MNNVVVTGLGFVTSIGNDYSTVQKNLLELKHGIILYPPFQNDKTPIKVAAPVPEFITDSGDPEDWTCPEDLHIPRTTLRALPPHGAYAMYAMQQAIADANLSTDDISNHRTGLYTASAGSAVLTHRHVESLRTKGVNRSSPLGIIASVVGTLNFNLAAHYQIKGSSAGLASACASSGHALGHAFDEITLGRQDRMFVVGGEDCSFENFLSFASMRAISMARDPNNASRPFDKNRDGFVATGGCVVMILENEQVAKKRGAKIYSQFAGWAQATDGYHPAKPHPEGDGLTRAIQLALERTQLSPDKIDYINAHATSTPPGDAAEILALKKVFNTEKYQPHISSTKALTGHGLSLASIMEAAFCNMAMKEGFTPGSANISELDPAAENLNIPRETLDKKPKITLSNSSGFGGANTALIFKTLD